MTYTERLKGLFKQIGIGYTAGLVLSLLFAWLIGAFKYEFPENILTVVAGTIVFGTAVAVIVSAVAKAQYLAGKIAYYMMLSIKWAFAFSVIGSGGWVLFIIHLIIGLFLMVPVCTYMCIAYFVNIVYLIIMTILEKNNKVSSESSSAPVIDTIVSLVPLIPAIIVGIKFIGGFDL